MKEVIMPKRVYATMRQMITELKEWCGWGDDMLYYLKSLTVLKGVYRIMRREKEDSGYDTEQTRQG